MSQLVAMFCDLDGFCKHFEPIYIAGQSQGSNSAAFQNPNEWVKQPEDAAALALSFAALPGKGLTGQTFSLMRC